MTQPYVKVFTNSNPNIPSGTVKVSTSTNPNIPSGYVKVTSSQTD